MKNRIISTLVISFSIFTAMSAFSFVMRDVSVTFMAHSPYEWIQWSLLIVFFSLVMIFSTTLSNNQLMAIMIGYSLLPFSFLFKNDQVHFFLLTYNTGICFGFWSIAVLAGIHVLSRRNTNPTSVS
jgi:hypothetical protein